MIDKKLDDVIVGRVEPRIYVFTTNTIPNYLKIGDTYRPVNVRLDEWRTLFPTLVKKYEDSARINDDIYFRDFSIHQFLETDKCRARLQRSDIDSGIYYSKEFFKDATVDDIKEAIDDIKDDFKSKSHKYQFYNAVNRLAETISFARTENYSTRPNQDKTVENFKTAISNGRNNLLMYAVMRFGKSFTSMCCALEINNLKLVVIVSAKADVKIEWKKTIESHEKFVDFDFLTSEDLKANNNAIKERFDANKKVALFLTLQDLQGENIKDKHKELFGEKIDLLLIDETHFGARAEKYGQVLKTINHEKDVKNNKDSEDFIDINEAEEKLKVLNAKIRLHLSGTPYRILMGSEFKKEDIIAFYQFTDIVKDQQDWIDKNSKKPENDQEEDWANPYYGFPQMVRFAFNPNESSRKRLEKLRKSGISYAFSALLKPKSIKKAENGDNRKFIFEKEVLDLLEVIDGSKNDDELLGFLDYEKIKQGKMCRHIVIVLPYCSSCDAMEELIKDNKDKFKNLNTYEILNISGVDNPNRFKNSLAVKKAITNFESQGKKTITLTVNRMLTGSTVQEWDTMLYLKDTSSPQEYDQAIFRLQNQYIKTYKTDDNKIIKYNMKPQTLLVDFMPNRMFVMQEQKAQIYNVNIDDGGNNKLKQRIEEELKISPIITLNSNKIKEVQACDILEVVSNYKMDKGIKDEALEIPVDLNILNIAEIKAVIENENEIGSKAGLSAPVYNDEMNSDEIQTPSTTDSEEHRTDENNEEINDGRDSAQQNEDQKTRISLTKKIQSYYTRILLFAYITDDIVASLKDIIDTVDNNDNKRIACNLGLKKEILDIFYNFYFTSNKWTLRDLDYKIQDLNNLSHKSDLTPEQKASVAVNKFGKLGDAVVITPSNICDRIISLLPNDAFKNDKRILDIAGVSGEFAISVVKKMKTLGIDNEAIKNNIYTIPKTSICYELIRKVYKMLDLNTKNIATFYAEDLLKITNNNNIDYAKINKLISQKKDFSEIKPDDNLEGDIEMIEYEAVVGNPPYQENDGGGTGSSAKALYDKFFIISKELSQRYVSLIMKSNWMTGGKGLKEFRHDVLSDNSFVSLVDYVDSKSCFDSAEIEWGVCYFLRDKNYTGKCNCVFNGSDGYKEINDRFLNDYSNTLYIRSFIGKQIVDKIKDFEFTPFSQLVAPRGYFKGEVKESDLTDVPNSNYRYQYVSNKHRTIKYLKNNNVITFDDDRELIGSYKLFISKADGAAGFVGLPIPAKIIGKTELGEKNDICSETFLAIGPFGTENTEKRDNCSKYLQTKFCRFFIGLIKQKNMSQDTYQLVPIQDFTNHTIEEIEASKHSLIDWSKPITEIDEQLYEKYKLSDKEKDFIEKMIKPME